MKSFSLHGVFTGFPSVFPRLVAIALPVVLAAPALAQQPRPAKTGFADARTGEIPVGAAELITAETQRAIENGLAWLAKQQNADGSFGSGAYRGNVAVTSLAALAMMASGSSPGRGRYGTKIDHALQFVLDNASSSGLVAGPTSAGFNVPMYAHGFGTLFLAEAYGMTRRPEIREKLEKAVRLIIDTQNGEGGLALPAGSRRRRPLGDHLPNQRASRRAKCRNLRPEGNGRRLHPLREAEPESRRRLPLHALSWRRKFERVSALGGGRGGAVFRGGVRREGSRRRHPLSEERHSHEIQGVGPARPLLLRTVLRGAGDVDSRRRRLDRLVSHGSRRDAAATVESQGSWSDSFGNEYGTAMALLVLQMPNNYLPIFQR